MDGVLIGKPGQLARARFQSLLDTHRGIVFKVAALYCRDAEERRDLAQDIATQAWRSFPNYDPARAFPTWLYRIALNVAISHLRTHGGRETVALEDIAEPAHDEDLARETDDGLRTLQRCIGTLDPLDRALLLLYLDERPQREIADVLGLSETNVATRIGRLKQRLRGQMGQ